MMSYSIGEVANMLGISTYAIRYYDKEGLLPFVKRSKSGIRIFEKTDLHFLYVIFCLKNTGMSIEKIRQFIAWANDGDKSLQQRYNLFMDQKAEIERQIRQLETYKECINDKCKYYKEALEAGTEAIHFDKKQEEDEMILSKIIRRESK
jgi:DNA-binding transcriptional MerR regulator